MICIEPIHYLDLDEAGYFNFCLINQIGDLSYEDIILLIEISKMTVLQNGNR